MDTEDIVDRYLAVCNRRDVKGTLALLHEGAAYFDAFWRESCVGSDLAQYFEDWFQSDCRYYQRISRVTRVGDAASYRYSAHDEGDIENCPSAYEGAEVLIIRAGKILTISDFYCSPDPEDLREVSMLAQKRHGECKYAHAGLSAAKSSVVRNQLVSMIETDAIRQFSNLAVSEFVVHLGCSVQQLIQVVNAEFRTSLDRSMQQHDVMRVSELLPLNATT